MYPTSTTMQTKPAAPQWSQATNPSSSPVSANSYDNVGEPSPCISTIPSSDDLQGCATPNSTRDGHSTPTNSLRSPGGSSTYLISGHLDGKHAGVSVTNTPISTSSRPKPLRNACHPINERIRPEPPYHVLPHGKKKTMMYLAAIAGMFSSLSANIYFPALGQISTVSQSPFYFKGGLPANSIASGNWGWTSRPQSYNHGIHDCAGCRSLFLGTIVRY